MASKGQNCNMVIDVGNTLSKVALFCDDRLLTVESHEKLSFDLFDRLLKNYNVERAIVSAVGELPPDFAAFFPQHIPVIFFNDGIRLPITNSYKTPGTLGSDRLVLAVAAHTLYPNSNVLVIDSGSAITYDLVTDKGEYLGGAISPGIDMRFKALNTFTAKLPLLSIDDEFTLVGTTTKESILSGVLNGVLDEVNGFIKRIDRLYSPLRIVFTGGNANFFEKKLKNSIFVHPNLLIFGLNRILNYNA